MPVVQIFYCKHNLSPFVSAVFAFSSISSVVCNIWGEMLVKLIQIKTAVQEHISPNSAALSQQQKNSDMMRRVSQSVYFQEAQVYESDITHL